jgi:hypothetical protein
MSLISYLASRLLVVMMTTKEVIEESPEVVVEIEAAVATEAAEAAEVIEVAEVVVEIEATEVAEEREAAKEAAEAETLYSTRWHSPHSEEARS